MAPYPAESAALSVGLFDFSRGFDPAALLCVLTAAERDRWRHFSQPARAYQYLASRWLLRVHIGCRLELVPDRVPLRYAAGAPPRVDGIGWHIGLSHSGRLCLCVVSKQAPAGCDVEWHRPRNVAAIAAAYFHPTEAAQLTACGPAQKLAAFYRLWTLKEAALKSQAHGLTAGLRTPAFTLAPRLTCLQAHAAGAWTFAAATRRLGAIHYSLALAVAGAPTPWSVLWHTPAAAKYLASAQSMPWQTATSGTGRPG